MSNFFNKKNINTIFILIAFFIYFIIATNYSLLWFTDMGTENISNLQNIKISFLPLIPYWIFLIIGICRKFKSENFNYIFFIMVFIINMMYYFYLSNKTPVSLLNNY